jgi:mannose-6-phosphate isomerase-like protein (cupin superfamily)
MEPINLQKKFEHFNAYWTPKIIAELNGQQIKIAKVKGDFVWHSHKDEDELFFVVQGKLSIEFRDKTVKLNAGELLVVPKGVEHKPFAEEEVLIMLFEPAATKHTGDNKTSITVDNCERI